jgi:hypothetical protein
LEDKKDNNEREDLLKKIEECPSKRVKEALKDSLNKENTTVDKDA